MMEQETLSLKALPSAEQATQSTVPAPAAERERTAGASAEDRIRELTEENELLFEQLHVVQEELEKYYHRLKECEQRTAAPTAGSGVCSAKALDAFMENWKLRALVQQQKIALQVVCRNSLPARLGKILITGVGSTSSFLSLPLKLRRMWKAIDRTVPPPELGGKDFSEAIKAYAKASEINPEYEFGYIGIGILYYNEAIEIQDKAAREMDDAKYMKLVEEFETALMNAADPFERAFAITKDKDIKVNIAEYLKNIYYRFREEDPKYMESYQKYDAIVTNGAAAL